MDWIFSRDELKPAGTDALLHNTSCQKSPNICQTVTAASQTSVALKIWPLWIIPPAEGVFGFSLAISMENSFSSQKRKAIVKSQNYFHVDFWLHMWLLGNNIAGRRRWHPRLQCKRCADFYQVLSDTLSEWLFEKGHSNLEDYETAGDNGGIF